MTDIKESLFKRTLQKKVTSISGEEKIYDYDRWVGELSFPDPSNPDKTINKTFYCELRAEAKEKLDNLKNDLKNNAYVPKNKLTVSLWLDQWLPLYKKTNVEPTTYADYESTVKTYIKPKLGDILLQRLSTDTVQRFLNEVADRPRTAQKCRQLLFAAFKKAVQLNKMSTNPVANCETVTVPKKKRQGLSAEQARQVLIAAAPHRLYAFIALDLALGLRRGELLALKWKQIDFEAKTLDISERLVMVGSTLTELDGAKTESGTRRLGLNPDLIAILKKHQVEQAAEKAKTKKYHDEDYVFCTPYGKRYWPQNITARFIRPLFNGLGFEDYKMHDLRHTHGSLGAKGNIDPKVMQHRLGHKSFKTTYDIYVHSNLDQDRAITASVMKQLHLNTQKKKKPETAENPQPEEKTVEKTVEKK